MKRIKKWFLHNPLLKLVSLILAFMLWLFIVNTSNPKVSASVTVPYDVLNEKAIETNNQVYFTNTSTVKISYSVRMKYKNNVSADAFSAYINLEDYSVTGAVPVYIEIDSEVSGLISDVTVEPSVIHVTTESIQQKAFSIQKFVEGTPAEGYKAGDLSVVPESIYVKGPVSIIGKISFVGITVDIAGATTDVEGITSVDFYDANGNILEGIEENLSFAGDVSYSVPIYRIKSLSVNAFTGGAPATGYTVDSVETSPTFISVYGPEEILNKYSYIVIPGSDLNISGMSKNTTFNLNAQKYIPEGLTLVNQTPEITVYVKFRNIFDQKEETTANETTADAKGPGETVTANESPQSTEHSTEEVSESESTDSGETGGDSYSEKSEEEPEEDETDTIGDSDAEETSPQEN